MNTSFAFEDEIDLSRFNTLYKTESTADAAPITNQIPDGRYEVVVAEVSLTTSQSSGNPMIRWVLRITSSAFRDRILRKYSVITENSLSLSGRSISISAVSLSQRATMKRVRR